jgi:hypothetical protein
MRFAAAGKTTMIAGIDTSNTYRDRTGLKNDGHVRTGKRSQKNRRSCKTNIKKALDEGYPYICFSSQLYIGG